MKNLVVLYFKNDWRKKIPFLKKADRKAFESWYKLAPKKGIKMFRAYLKWYDRKRKIFIKAWHFDNRKWAKKINIKPDFIYDRLPSKKDAAFYKQKQELNRYFKILNNPKFRLLFGSKHSQYKYFYEFMPKTVLLENKNQLKRVKKIKTSKIVIKPFYGSGGYNILIINKNSVKKYLKKINFPVIAQEMIDGSRGVKNISNTLADLRLVFVDNKFIYACSRIAKKGSLFTNFHQGAKMIVVPKNKIPKEIFKLLPEIQKKLQKFKKNDYSLDFMFEGNRPFLIEMNTTPGVDYFSPKDYKIREKYFLAVLKSFLTK